MGKIFLGKQKKRSAEEMEDFGGKEEWDKPRVKSQDWLEVLLLGVLRSSALSLQSAHLSPLLSPLVM